MQFYGFCLRICKLVLLFNHHKAKTPLVGLGEKMNRSMDKSVRAARFAIADFQKRISVLEATRDDLERQVRKLNESVPEAEVSPNATKEGYVAYGSYANSVIQRRVNIERTMCDIDAQNTELSTELKLALDSLDSFERVRARQLAMKAEKAAQKALKRA